MDVKGRQGTEFLMKRLILLLQILLLFSPLVQAAERELSCKVVGISDGDTLTCLYNFTQLKVRLQYIDAPESAQPFGNRAKQALSALAYKKTVRLQISGYDKYQRQLAVVWDGSKNINLALVEQGMAWAYRETQPLYQQAETAAKSRKIGLWRDSNPINPADWRAVKRSNSAENWQRNALFAPASLSSGINCSVKKSCKQLGDYPNALRHFQQCGWRELDGNNDGIPCNQLYRKAQK